MVKLDPAYPRGLRQMIDATVWRGDLTLDIGCGTGLGTVRTAEIATHVIGIDPSEAMTRQLRRKLRQRGLRNIEVRLGLFPEVLTDGELAHSVISSFMLAHLEPPQRKLMIAQMFDWLQPGGRLGLFSARGEVAHSFQTRVELRDNLSGAGFEQVEILDVWDVYRITTACKPH